MSISPAKTARHRPDPSAIDVPGLRDDLTTDGLPLDGDNLRKRVFYRLLDKANVKRIRLHDLRHTNDSLLIQNGESPACVRDQLGHSSIQVTVDI